VTQSLYRQLDTTYLATTGKYDVFICARPRPDQRWEGLLEFRPVRGGDTIATNVQTTQRTAEDVFRWAAALSDSHIEGSFSTATRPRHDGPPGISAMATPPRTEDRNAYLRPIEREVLDLFRSTGRTRIATTEFFQRGPHANADFVRAFEDLEKQGRYLVRHTAGGTDWVELTTDGASALGVVQTADRLR